jgi:hypothetical protein
MPGWIWAAPKPACEVWGLMFGQPALVVRWTFSISGRYRRRVMNSLYTALGVVPGLRVVDDAIAATSCFAFGAIR